MMWCVVQKHKSCEANPKPRRLYMLNNHLVCTKPAVKWDIIYVLFNCHNVDYAVLFAN